MNVAISDLPVGEPVVWSPAQPPDGRQLEGSHCRLVELAPEHVAGLYEALCSPGDDAAWTYMSGGPFDDASSLGEWLMRLPATESVGYVVLDGSGRPQGTASYLRIEPGQGSVEVGSIVYSPRLRRTVAATEAMFLMARHVFDDLGFRRYEWKCDALNAASRSAALRLGFSFEGVFRNAMVVKGRNRDTAWFAMTDADWLKLRPVYEAWLAPENQGSASQLRSLSALTKRALTR